MFSEQLYTATSDLESQSAVTLHMVVPWGGKLKQHCTIADEDCDNIVALKDTCLAMLEEKFNPHILHKAAVFSNPRQKSMMVMPHSDQQLALDYTAD